MIFEQTKAGIICIEADLFFLDNNIKRHSLSPFRQQATSFLELGKTLSKWASDEVLFSNYCSYFTEVSKAQFVHFPENIFWDADYLFFYAFKEINDAPNPSEYLINYMETLLALLKLFGENSTIKFRYLHDFIYGFDWAKWIKKTNLEHKNVGPFQLPFLKRMYKRGQELEILIKKNDQKYHQLKKGEKYRNPFLFLREPDEEKQLLSYLSETGLIPVKCWQTTELPIWNKAFEVERIKISKKLGLQK